MAQFLDELADINSTICTFSNDFLLSYGDMIYPSFDSASSDSSLAAILDSFVVEQLADVPRCDRYLHDILATHARNVICDDADCISCVVIFFGQLSRNAVELIY